MVINHLGTLDGPLALIAIPRDDATGLVADKHKKNPLFRFIIEQANGIWIDRDSSDVSALKDSRDYLKNGGLLGIAPEGTRSPTHKLIQAKDGAAFLAAQLGNLPILPAAFTGTEDAFQQIGSLRRPHITMTFGKPFILPPLDRKDRDGSLHRNTDEMMCRIAALLPAKYHGVYANHPRLFELIAQGAGEYS